jgi:hypothetical protein
VLLLVNLSKWLVSGVVVQIEGRVAEKKAMLIAAMNPDDCSKHQFVDTLHR